MNKKKFKVIVEQELEIALDMDRHTKESLEQYKDYWGFDSDNDEDTIREIVEHITLNYLHDGYFDQDAEGLVFEGFNGKAVETKIDVSQKL